MKRLFSLLLAASAALTATGALGQAFPNRPITLICPWTPGGNTDAALRALADAMARILGNKRIIVENKPGVGGALGAQYLAQQAKPDGHTIAQIPLGVYRLPFLTKTSFNPVTDLTYIIGVAGYNFGLTVRSDAPWKTWQEFIAHAKANPDKVRYGSPGIGTSLHITMEDIAVREGIKWIHVPFKAQQSQLALLSGEVEALTGSPPWGLVEAGKVRPLTTWSANRPARAPNVPTLKEIYGIVANSPWGIAGPKGLDPQIVKILHDTIRKAMDDAVFLQQLDRFGQEIHYMSPATYSEYARHALEKEKEIVERLGLAGKT